LSVLDSYNFRLPHLVIYSARRQACNWISNILFNIKHTSILTFVLKKEKTLKGKKEKLSLTLNVLLLSWSDLIFLVDSCLFNNKINFKNLIYCKIKEDVTTMLLYQLFGIVSSLNILFKVNSDRGENVWTAQLVIYLDQSLMFVLFHLRNQVFQPYISMQSDVGFRPNWIKHKISLRRIKR